MPCQRMYPSPPGAPLQLGYSAEKVLAGIQACIQTDIDMFCCCRGGQLSPAGAAAGDTWACQQLAEGTLSSTIPVCQQQGAAEVGSLHFFQRHLLPLSSAAGCTSANQAVANGFPSLHNTPCVCCCGYVPNPCRLNIGQVRATQVNTYSWTIQRQSSASGVAVTADGYSRKQMGEPMQPKKAVGSHHAASIHTCICTCAHLLTHAAPVVHT